MTASNEFTNTASILLETRLFKKVEDPMSLLPVLKSRLPLSCFMVNQLEVYEKFKDEVQAFSMETSENENKEEDLWIVFRFDREDWGPTISISSPTSDPTAEIPNEVQIALEKSEIFDYSKPFLILAVGENVSDFLLKLNIHKFGNITKILPTHLFYMDPADALKLEVRPVDSNVQVRPLNATEDTQFLTKNWMHSKQGSETVIRKSIEGNVSVGVFVNGEIACGAITPGYGIVSNLLTSENHRRKGYASLAVKYLFREMALEGLYPCLDADISDAAAVKFHKSVNPRIIGRLYYISHKAI